MKKNISIFFAAVVAFALASCTGDNDGSSGELSSGRVEATTIDFDEQTTVGETTRSSFTYVNGYGLKFAWNEGDELGIFAYSDNPDIPLANVTRFAIVNATAGDNSATFANDGFMLNESLVYYAFSPWTAMKSQSDMRNLTLDYTGQRQVSNNPTTYTSHLGAYDYQVSIANFIGSEATMHFNHLGAVLHLKITMPDAGTFNKLEFSTADNYKFPMTRTIDLTNGNCSKVSDYSPSFKSTAGTDTKFTLALGETDEEGISVSANEVLHAFIMIPAGSELKGKTVNAVLKSVEGNDKDYYCSFTGRSGGYLGGHMYAITGTAEKTSVITENIEVYSDWQNGSTKEVTRTTGDPGTESSFAKPKYLTIYTCDESNKVIDVFSENVEDKWQDMTNGWKYQRTLSLDTKPTSLHVYAVASSASMTSLSPSATVVEDTEESVLQSLKFTSTDQSVLSNTYADIYPFAESTGGSVTVSGSAVSLTARLYHVASKIDVNWQYTDEKVTTVAVDNLLSTGYLFQPTANDAVTSGGYTYTLPAVTVDQQYYGREYFYAIQQKNTSGYFPLYLKINGSAITTDNSDYVRLTPGAQMNYSNCTSWFRVNVK